MPHEYAISLTLKRSLKNHQGGHFYLASYGLKVESAEDTVIVWRPKDWHGTSLQEYPPSSQKISEFNQTGLAFVMSNRLSTVWKKYADSCITREEAEKELMSPEEDDNGEADNDKKEQAHEIPRVNVRTRSNTANGTTGRKFKKRKI